MKKKALSLALVFALILSLCPWAMAADVRETDFFEDQPHTELNFSEIEYKHIEIEPILAAMEEIRGLMASADNADAVAEKFNAVADQVMEMVTMSSIASILTYQDATNASYVEEQTYMDAALNDVVDAFSLLICDLLASPCAHFLTEQLTEDDLEYYQSYEAMTEEEKSLSAQEQALVLEYYAAALQPCTVEHEGQAMTEADVYAAAAAGSLDAETGNALLTELAKAKNSVLGDIYLKMVAVRSKIAKAAGYDNYGDYAYAEVYGRDYTQKEIHAFHQAVKEYMVPVSGAVSSLAMYQLDDSAIAREDYQDTAVDMIAPYIAQMSSELKEALDYMCDHNMYDITYSETKQGVGFTTMLYSFGAPFMFNQPGGDLYDFTTVVHELGHYNNFYWQDASWNAASDNIDTAEVHSQGLELLFSHYYPEIFGDSASAVTDYLMTNLTYALVQGCLYDELQQYVYATPNVTLKQINQEYCKLAKEYGLVESDDERTEMYGWVDVSHTFDSPMYYISYAVSAAGAFAFWLDAQEGDFMDTVDQYLTFVALPAELGFQESFETMEMANPISEEFIAQLAQELMVKLNVEKRLNAAALSSLFTDLEGMHWYDEYVLTMVLAGLISGYEDGTFRPASEVTWGQGLKLVLLLAGQEEQAPVEGGGWASGYQALAVELGLLDENNLPSMNQAISRTDLCRILAMALDIPASEAESPFTDTDNGYVLALSELGVITGYTADDGTQYFGGEDGLKRTELCTILYRMVEALSPEETAA